MYYYLELTYYGLGVGLLEVKCLFWVTSIGDVNNCICWLGPDSETDLNFYQNVKLNCKSYNSIWGTAYWLEDLKEEPWFKLSEVMNCLIWMMKSQQ